MPRGRSNGASRLSRQERAGFYKAIFGRRDVRGHFRPNPVPEATLARILNAAHHAGSVGFMQPWNFILIKAPRIKRRIKKIFLEANAEAARAYKGSRRTLYESLKLEGILEAPVNICVTCDRSRGGPHVLGRSSIPETDLYSTCCAVQNLWLAARAEGIGVGWVSILNQETLRKALKIPRHVVPVAYLCLGYVRRFLEKPELELAGWGRRRPLDELIYFEEWGRRKSPADWGRLEKLVQSIKK